MHEELWLVHICCLVEDLDVFLEVVEEAADLLNNNVVLGLFHDLAVWWVADIGNGLFGFDVNSEVEQAALEVLRIDCLSLWCWVTLWEV